MVRNVSFQITIARYKYEFRTVDGVKKIIETPIEQVLKQKLRASGFLIASGKIYITTNLGYLIVCQVNTGKVEKVLKISRSELSSPLINNNSLYILTNKSLIVF